MNPLARENSNSNLPLSPEQLLEQAELAGKAVIVAVVKAKDDVTPHVAHLRFETITKGTPRTDLSMGALLPWRRTVKVKMRRVKRDAQGNPLPGQWWAGYRAGDRIMTHLVWDDELDAYSTLCWNAVWQVPS
jgi:hypothetical protein